MKRKDSLSPKEPKNAREMDLEDDEFEVRHLLNIRFNNALGTFEYLVDWADTIKPNGITQTWDPTWEPEENISAALLLAFVKQFPTKKARLIEANSQKSQYCNECKSEHKKIWARHGHSCLTKDKSLKVSTQLQHNHSDSEANIGEKGFEVEKKSNYQRKPLKLHASQSEQSLSHGPSNDSSDKEPNHRNSKSQKSSSFARLSPSDCKGTPNDEDAPLIKSVNEKNKLDPVAYDEHTPLMRTILQME
ncbi:hypothetical protein BJ742DRAFT_11122 [Cladochytrium replicatum]|nr:hypothetical protein BJ742DRAFT_11122 [Cladochytrium replicatum]